ncbi:hypothetical protein GVN20_14535 [Runella sp. CRIBMP]|jgi:hypothetical protein|uniref:hypothetical protein n=1 Tax=Runella sp. CRIBMP TaxID=2683261 RepID=UPI0014122CAD|nr:hypothetical protein [Runella sp. CRIBMP]NBB20580.1 hypothetical protein [Runella sp. CRIBMP]
MATTQTSPLKLNEAQMLILQLFQHRHMNEEELTALRRTLVQHLSKELDIVVERAMKEKGITVEDIERASAEINEHRGNYLKKIRSQQ